MFELVSGFVWILSDSFAENDASLVEEDVPLHRFETQFAHPVPFPFRPHAESSLEQQPAQLGQAPLFVRHSIKRIKISLLKY